MLLPYRYWAALLIGEAIPNAFLAFKCLADFGPAWVAIRCIPEMLVSMPIVWLCRSQLNVFPTRHLVNVKALLTCVLMVSIALSTYAYVLMFSSIHVPAALYAARPQVMGVYLTGNFGGLLTLVPWALIARLDYRKGRVTAQFKRLWTNKLLVDAMGIAVPVIAGLTLLAAKLHDAPTQLIELGMIVPAAWLTAKHGWRAAALAGTAVLICDSLLHPLGMPTPAALETIAGLCVAVSGLYVLGAKVSAQKIRDEHDRAAAEEVHDMARQHLMTTERRMRRAAERLEFVAGSMHVANAQTLEHMRRIVPNIESHAFYKQAVKAHEQVYLLAESLHPAAWRDRGLPAALNETLARALDEAGLQYQCEIDGRGFMFLEAAVHTAIYRTACEGIVYVTSDITCSSVKLVVRAGETSGRRWVVVRVEGYLDANDVAKGIYFGQNRRELAAKLGANLSSVKEMRAHARTFDGMLHVRSDARRVVVSALLHSQSLGVQKHKNSEPLRLWVS
ncbi:hypothetical protein [Dyella mobilis]|uniref:hypothetical protein n=1 Tax=Dyella mobilis TaxID=1849582 RepID=UPI001957BA88|nr:hypothetical protein [Dyella mobilis]